jgi:hypothetical protein
MKLVHKPGTTNQADALSHHPGYNNGSSDNKAIMVLPDHFFCCAISFLDTEEQVRIAHATVGRTRYYSCVHMAILRVCDTCALDAADRDAVTVRHDLLFMGSLAFYLYNTRYVL